MSADPGGLLYKSGFSPRRVFDLAGSKRFYEINWAHEMVCDAPTIIEAAIALYEENTVEDITKHGGDIDKASTELSRIIDFCRENNHS